MQAELVFTNATMASGDFLFQDIIVHYFMRNDCGKQPQTQTIMATDTCCTDANIVRLPMLSSFMLVMLTNLFNVYKINVSHVGAQES